VFEWDPAKAIINLAKHGVAFVDALTVFADPRAIDGPSARHSVVEPRSVRLGRASEGRVLVIVYTMRETADGEAIRIISARRANRKERAAYAAD
jgi:hypothetical protein